METLGRYEILGELGRGGCGVVYRALDPGIGRTVAIKTIRADQESGDSLRERFRREARSAGNLSHPNIVTIHEFNDSGEVMFIAMEFIDGSTLSQRMKAQALPLEFILATMRSAASALDFAHASNIVHRDVKPANFLITKSGHLKITDFGIAKMLDSDVSLTNTGMVVGTAQYMSPEQIAAKEVTGRSDQFSLAVIAYEMLTGQRPFQGNSWASMMHNIMASEPPPLKQYRENLGDAVTDVLRKALAKEPRDRYSSCREFSDALERSILGTTAEQKVFWEGALKTPNMQDLAETMLTMAAQTQTEIGPGMRTTVWQGAPPPKAPASAPTTTREIPPVAPPSRSWAIPVVTGVVIALGLAAWVGLRNGRPQEAAPPSSANGTPSTVAEPAQPSGQQPSGQQSSGATVAESRQAPTPPALLSRPLPGSSSASADTKGRVAEEVRSAAAPAVSSVSSAVAIPAPPPAPVAPAASAAPATPVPAASSTPQPAPPAATQPPPQPAPVARVVEPPPQPAAAPAPAPAPVAAAAPAPPRGPDPAEIAAQRRAAELQASRRMIAEAANRYRQAFESRDLEALKAVWPGLGRNEQNAFQNFFRLARSVKLQLTPVGEPEITASGATARYRRSLSATDERGALPAQDQTVRITFRKSGEQMLIDAIETAGR